MIKQVIWRDVSDTEKKVLLQRSSIKERKIFNKKVNEIVQVVKAEGDKACHAFTKQFDNVLLDTFKVTENEIKEAFKQVDSKKIKLMKKMMSQLRKFHTPQRLKSYEISTGDGIICASKALPIEKIGLYIPGGTAPLISTVFMLGIPAQIAGCPMRILLSPPNQKGELNPYMLVAATICGIQSIYKLGGAQAIAAMAYGTETIPKVDKIFGPGNAWVMQAKKIVDGDVSGARQDLSAGPSEVMVIADRFASAELIAADLLSQLEHGVNSQAIFISLDQTLIERVISSINRQITLLARNKIIKKSLNNCTFIYVEQVTDAINIANNYAPEHLILMLRSNKKTLAAIKNAGSVFVGAWSPEAVGDYGSGTNHVLPTDGYAKTMSGLTVRDFMKTMTVQTLTKHGLSNMYSIVSAMSDLEGLDGHKNAAVVRMKRLSKLGELCQI